MICKNCGKEILDGEKFCKSCGNTVESVQLEVDQQPKKYQEIIDTNNRQDNTVSTLNTKKYWIVSIVFTCLIPIVFFSQILIGFSSIEFSISFITNFIRFFYDLFPLVSVISFAITIPMSKKIINSSRENRDNIIIIGIYFIGLLVIIPILLAIFIEIFNRLI